MKPNTLDESTQAMTLINELEHGYAIDLELKNLDQFFCEADWSSITDYQNRIKQTIYALAHTPLSFRFISYNHIECIYLASTKDKLMHIVQELDDALYSMSDQRLFLGIGIEEIQPQADPYLCMRNAKLARTLSKDAHKLHTHIEWFQPSMLDALMKQRSLEQHLHRALGTHAFQMVIQPKVSCCDERVCGGEALIRLPFSDGMDIDTFYMITLAEANGLIEDIDLYMFEEVCRFQSQRMKHNDRLLPISVNISRVHFHHPRFFEAYLKIYKKYSLPDHCIELEITESAHCEHQIVSLSTFIKQFHEAGFLVSLDDFGSGQSTLGLLSNLEFDIIKLDRSFFLHDHQAGQCVIEMILDLAHRLHMQSVAEGIETKAQAAFLKAHGCDMIQGYYYAPPLHVEEFLAYVKTHS